MTCMAKSLYKMVAQQYREKIQQDLIATEEYEKRKNLKNQKKKKGKKQKCKKMTEILSFMTFESETEKGSVNLQKNFVFSTPPNSPKWSISKSFEEIELIDMNPKQMIDEQIEWIDNQVRQNENQEISKWILNGIVENSLNIYGEKEEFEQQKQKEKRKERKKEKKLEKSQKLKEEKDQKGEKDQNKENNKKNQEIEQNKEEEEIWIQDWMEDKKQNNIPTFKNSNISDSLSKSNGTGGTATTTSKDTSEEEMLLQIFNKKKGYKKTRNQKTQTSYYKGYQIKSDQNLKLARSNNFPLRKEQQEEIEMQDIKKNKKIETIKEEVNESNNTKQNNNSDIQDIVNEDYNGNNNIKEQAKQKIEEKFSQDIDDYCNDLLDIYFRLLPYRTLIFNRIKGLIQQIFCKLISYSKCSLESEIRLFGSCVTGLALPDSDIDVGILGFELYPRSSLIVLINPLLEAFKSIPWVISIKPIFSCAVPIIKLEVDPTIQDQFSLLNLNEKQLEEFKHEDQKFFKVDISFNQFDDHHGQQSTEQILNWIKETPQLQQLVIIFKALVKQQGLNEPYKGGLSSYSLIIMVYSYLQSHNNNQTIGETFLNFCRFYGYSFDPQQTGIRIMDENQRREECYFKLSYANHPITIMSPISNKVISQSSIYVNKILQSLKQFVEQSKELERVYMNYLQNKQKRRVRKNNLELINQVTKDNLIALVIDRK